MSDEQEQGASLRDRAATPTGPSQQAVSGIAGIPSARWRDAADLSTVKWPLGSYAPGNYMAKCHGCGDTVTGIDKRALLCLSCAIDAVRQNAEAMESALRIRIWNDARQRGVCQDDALAEVTAEIGRIIAQGGEAGTATTGTGVVHEHPVGSADAPVTPGDQHE